MEELKELLPTPTSPLSDLVSTAFEAGGKGKVVRFLQDFAGKHPGYEDEVCQKESITLFIDGEENGQLECIARLKPRKKSEKPIRVRVQFDKKLLESDSAACKIWSLIAGRIIQSCYNIRAREFISYEVELTLIELSELGVFRSTEIARKCLDQALEKLRGVRIKVSLKEDGRDAVYYLSLVDGWKRSGGSWTVFLNTRIPPVLWLFLFQSYTRLPTRAFKLSNQAFGVVRFLTVYTNRNQMTVRREGGFNLNILNLAGRLGFDLTTPHKKQLILTPLTRIVEEINKAKLGFRLKLPSSDFLAGKLSVRIDAELLEKVEDEEGEVGSEDGSGGAVYGSESAICGSGSAVSGSGGAVGLS